MEIPIIESLRSDMRGAVLCSGQDGYDAARTIPNAMEGSYVNYVSDEGEASARAAYGPNYDRLVALKNKYDPTNFFRMNHNIQPVAAGSA